MEVLDFISSKNQCLRKFLEVSEEFLGVLENGDFSTIEHYHTRREAIIRTMDLFDRKITEAIMSLPENCRTPALAIEAQRTLEEKDRLLASIQIVDERIIQIIEAEKSKVAQELSLQQKSKATLQKFKSTWVAESGEDLDSKL